MSRVREPFHRFRETLRDALRRENHEIRPDDDRAGAPHEGDDQPPERPDRPLGVPASDEREGSTELPGFPQDDPSQG